MFMKNAGRGWGRGILPVPVKAIIVTQISKVMVNWFIIPSNSNSCHLTFQAIVIRVILMTLIFLFVCFHKIAPASAQVL